jgi:hypothetical protein
MNRRDTDDREIRRRLLNSLADRFPRPLVAATGQSGEHRGDRVIGEQVDRGEGVMRLQAHIVLEAIGVGDGAHPWPRAGICRPPTRGRSWTT